MKNIFLAGLIGLFFSWASPVQAQSLTPEMVEKICDAVIAECPSPSADDGEGCTYGSNDFFVTCITLPDEKQEKKLVSFFGSEMKSISFKLIDREIYQTSFFVTEEEEKEFLLGVLSKIPELQHLVALLK